MANFKKKWIVISLTVFVFLLLMTYMFGALFIPAFNVPSKETFVLTVSDIPAQASVGDIITITAVFKNRSPRAYYIGGSGFPPVKCLIAKNGESIAWPSIMRCGPIWPFQSQKMEYTYQFEEPDQYWGMIDCDIFVGDLSLKYRYHYLANDNFHITVK